MVYSPAEDSWLLAEHVPEPFGSREFLDLGCGTGVVGVTAAKKGWRVTCTDLDPLAVESARENFEQHGLPGEFLVGNLFEPVRGRRFDVIAFNPPYLPTGPEDKKAEDRIVWDGGPDGARLAVEAVKSAGDHLAPGGVMLLLASSLGNVKRIVRTAGESGLTARVIAGKRLFFEELVVLEIARKNTF